jgi:hypothetical protein
VIADDQQTEVPDAVAGAVLGVADQRERLDDERAKLDRRASREGPVDSGRTGDLEPVRLGGARDRLGAAASGKWAIPQT